MSVSLNKLKRAFWEWLVDNETIPKKPNPPVLTQLGKVIVTMLNYKLTLPPTTATDVAKWEMETTLGTAAPAVADVKDGDTVSYDQGAVVSLRVREVDDAGNNSDWSDPFAFTASDTLPPSKPNAPSLELVSET